MYTHDAGACNLRLLLAAASRWPLGGSLSRFMLARACPRQATHLERAEPAAQRSAAPRRRAARSPEPPKARGLLLGAGAALGARQVRCRVTRKAALQEAPVKLRPERGKVLENHEAFPPPPKVPTTWWQLAHHVLFIAVGLYTVFFQPSWIPDWQLVIVMYLYSDFMSALLHRTFDHEECLKVPALDFVAYGFQMHHAWPMESTKGVGLYRLFCDTVRIQWILLVCFAVLSSHTLLAGQILYLKLLFGAYGSAVGHFYAHFPKNLDRPS